MATEIEIHRIDLPWSGLRVSDPARQARLVASISRDGQQQPVLVVSREPRFALVDGYRRLSALQALGRDVVLAVTLALTEADALAFAHRIEANRRRSALEDGWLLRELIETFQFRQPDLARLLQRSASWVSRRLALVRLLPEIAQVAVREGRIGAHAAEKCLVPLARANRAHAERLVRNLGDYRPTDRQMQRLYSAWRSADAASRERIVDHPVLFVRSDEEVASPLPPDDPATTVVRALEAITGTCGRARKVVRDGALHRLDPGGLEAIRRAFDEASVGFGAVRRLLSEEGLDARRRDEVGGPEVGEGTAQRAGDRQGPGDLARDRPADPG